MAFKAKCLGSRFSNHLNGLREEFDLQCNAMPAKSTGPHLFNIYLESLKCEFEVMTEDLESLRKERDEFQVKVEAQEVEIQNFRNNVVCQRCGKETASTSRITKVASSPLKICDTAPSSSLTPPVRSEYLNTPSLVINASQQAICWFTRLVTVTRKPHLTITPSRSSQSTTSQCPDFIIAHSQTIARPSPLRQSSAPTVDSDSGLEVCDLSTNDKTGKELGIQLAHALAHREAIWSVKFSQDGKFLACGCGDGKSYVYDVRTGTLVRVLRDLLAEKELIRSVCFSHDGKYLATNSRNGSIYIWEINTKHIRNAFKGHTRWVHTLNFSPNDRLLVSASQDNTVRLWNIRDGAAKVLTDNNLSLNPYPQYTSAVFSPDGGHVVAAHHDGMVRLWHARTGQLMRRVKAHMDVVFDVAFTPDGEGLISGSMDKNMKYWDFSTWIPNFRTRSQMNDLQRCVAALEEQTLPEREYAGHDGSIYRLAVSSDSRWVASGSSDGTVRIWDARSTAMQYDLDHNDWVYSVDFSPAGHYLASGECDGTVRIWRYSSNPSGGIEVYEE